MPFEQKDPGVPGLEYPLQRAAWCVYAGRRDSKQGVLIVEIGQAGRGAPRRASGTRAGKTVVFPWVLLIRPATSASRHHKDHVCPSRAEHLGEWPCPRAATDYAYPWKWYRHVPRHWDMFASPARVRWR